MTADKQRKHCKPKGSSFRKPVASALLFAALCANNAVPSSADLPSQPPLKQIATISLPGVKGRIDHLAIDNKGKRLFVAALGNDTVEVIDISTNKRIKQITGLHEPQGVAFDAMSNQLFIAEGEGASLDIYDGATLKLKHKISELPDADNVRLTDAGKTVWVGYGNGAVAKIDASSGERRGICKLPGHPESFQISSLSNRMYANVPSAHGVYSIDTGVLGSTANWKLEPHDNYPMALNRLSEDLYIGCRNPAVLLVVNTTSGAVDKRLPLSGDVDDIFLDLDRSRLYAACGQGFVDVFQLVNNKPMLMYKLQTASGARTCVYSPAFEKLFVAVPSRGNSPAEIRVFANTGADTTEAQIDRLIDKAKELAKQDKLAEALNTLKQALHLDPTVTSRAYNQIHKLGTEFVYNSPTSGMEDIRVESGVPAYGISVADIEKMSVHAGMPVSKDSRNAFQVSTKTIDHGIVATIGVVSEIDDEGCKEGSSRDYQVKDAAQLRSRIQSVLAAYAAESGFTSSSKMSALQKQVRLIERGVPLRGVKQISVIVRCPTDPRLADQLAQQVKQQLKTAGIAVVPEAKGITQLTFLAAPLPGSKPAIYAVTSNLVPSIGKFDWMPENMSGEPATTTNKSAIPKLIATEVGKYIDAWKYAKTL